MVVGTVVAAVVVILASMSPGIASPSTSCTGTLVLTLSPGLSEQPSSGTFSTGDHPGTEQCDGPVQGHQPTGAATVSNEGRYGIRHPGDTCSAGGEGSGLAVHQVPTRSGTQTVENPFHIVYGGIARGFVSGTIEGDYFSGTFVVRPLEGDCLTAPITKAEVTFRGTWHEYRRPT